MKRALSGGCFLAILALAASADARADFDAATGKLTVPAGALRSFDFESDDWVKSAELLTWTSGGGFPALEHVPVAGATELAPFLATADDDVVEGKRALRFRDGRGLAITEPALFGELAKARFEVTLWARADGTAPQVQVAYGKDLDTALSGFSAFAQVRAIRTGRATSDGWAEYSTGPLDGSVLGTPAAAILVAPSPFAEPAASFVMDALEVRKLEGAPVAPVACTQANVEQTCGATGDCMFGHCIDSSVSWGVLPNEAHRTEIVERWAFWATRLIGDRKALQTGIDVLTPEARKLAKQSTNSRQFFGGMNRLVNLLRDNHTSFGSPSNFSSFAPQIQQGSSSGLGACFGIVEKDLVGGGLGFAVFRAAESPATGVPLQRGDLLVKIDGREPKEWLDENYPRFATTMANDAGADWSNMAGDLARIVTTRASTVTLARCASAASCTGGDQTTITIDIADAAYKALTGATAPTSSRSFGCSPRFSSSVTNLVAPSNNGEDPVSFEPGPNGETRVQFDGFSAGSRWKTAMTNIFSGRPAKVMMDAREGHGGLYDAVEHMFGLLRGTADPMGVLSIGRGGVSLAEPPWLLDRVSSCTRETAANQWSCFLGNSNGFLASVADPPGAATKIAWLNTRDVSANDFMPRLLQGRPGFRVFGPHVTSGAFGAVVSLPPVSSGWSGGSIQIQDSRFAPDTNAIKAARWESGFGVAPDEVVVQKLSDTLSGTDTILAAAAAWLESQ